MIARHKRMLMVAGILAGVGLAAWLGTHGVPGQRQSFPATHGHRRGQGAGRRGRAAGWHGAERQRRRTQGTLDVDFLVTDFKHTVPVTYSGVLPDLFRDGQGVVAHGRMQDGVFVADEILAKHDEKYMPPQVAEALKNNPPPPDLPPAGG